MSSFFLFNAPVPTQIYTLSLHDALPFSPRVRNSTRGSPSTSETGASPRARRFTSASTRSEEHTSELQSRGHLVCRLLLEKKKKKKKKQRNARNKTEKQHISIRGLECSPQ